MTNQNPLQPFYNYMAAMSKLSRPAPREESAPVTEICETRSEAFPARVNVLIEAGSFAACQTLVQNIMDREGNASFTIPVQSANGSYVTYGHYDESREELPEL